MKQMPISPSPGLAETNDYIRQLVTRYAAATENRPRQDISNEIYYAGQHYARLLRRRSK